MNELWLYSALSRFGWLNYRAKIMLMAFVGTHIPLIALIAFYAARTANDWNTVFTTVGVALVATLAGTGLTLFVLNHLLRPVLMTSRGLRAYRTLREVPDLPTRFTDEAGTLLADAAHTLGELEARMIDLEYTDPVTGLANRRKLLRVVAETAEAGALFALVAIQIENYDRIAATFDQKVADRLIREIAERLTMAVGYEGRPARVDGDTFAFIAEGVDAGSGLQQLSGSVRDVIDRISGEVTLAEVRFVPEARSGLAFFPADASEAEMLLDHAVAASRSADRSAPIAFHAPALRQAARERYLLEQEIGRAIEREEFVLHYQPVVDLSLGRAVGAEALIRWQHPERGLLPPSRFIGAAETSGLIDPIGLWVMRQACAQVRSWNDAGASEMTVAINLSARQFLDPGLALTVETALSASGVRPGQLEIELTETAAMADYDHTRTVFGQLRDLGVGIAIDDFGTGYASMSYLRKLPFDKLKIDREFVSGVHQAKGSQAICGALVELARGLDLRVLAEGAETEEEVRHLHGRGCDLFQGYYFSKPLAAESFLDAVRGLSITSRAMHLASGPAAA